MAKSKVSGGPATKKALKELEEMRVMETAGAPPPTSEASVASGPEVAPEATTPKSSLEPQQEGTWVPVLASGDAGAEVEAEPHEPELAKVEVWYGSGI